MKKQFFLLSMTISFLTSSVALGGIDPEWEDEDGPINLIVMLSVLKETGRLAHLRFLLPGFKMLDPHFDINAFGEEGMLPLLMVLHLDIDEEQKKEALSVLIDNGADVNKPDKDGMTVLSYFVHQSLMDKARNKKEESDKNMRMIEFLLEKGADPEVKGIDEIPPLFFSILTHQKDILKVFLLKKPELAFDAFHFALGSRSFKVIDLIEDLGFDIKAFAVIGGVDSKPGYFEYQVYKKEKECGKVNESNDY